MDEERAKKGDKKPGRKPKSQVAGETFPCSVCKRELTSKYNYWKHMQSHKDAERLDRIRKMRRLAGERNRDKHGKYVCDECGNEYSSKPALDRHITKHTGEKRWKCKDCGKQFRLNDTLHRHIRSVHTKQKPHTCNICGRGFSDPANLQQHYYVHKKPQFECDGCGKMYKCPRYLRWHKIGKNGNPCRGYDAVGGLSEAKLPKNLASGDDDEPAAVPKKRGRPVGGGQPRKEKDPRNPSKAARISNMVFQCQLCSKTFLREGNLKRHSEKAHGVQTGQAVNGAAAVTAGGTNDNGMMGMMMHDQSLMREMTKLYAKHLKRKMRKKNTPALPSLPTAQTMDWPGFHSKRFKTIDASRFAQPETAMESCFSDAGSVAPVINPSHHSDYGSDSAASMRPLANSNRFNVNNINGQMMSNIPPGKRDGLNLHRYTQMAMTAAIDRAASVPIGSRFSTGESVKPYEGFKASVGAHNTDTVLSVRASKELDEYDAETLWAHLFQVRGLKACVCDSIFNDKVMFSLHRRWHDFENPKCCSFCQQEYETWQDLLKHSMDHNK